MHVDEMRAELMKLYPGEKWKMKVTAMSDDQVIAIWRRMLRDGQVK